MFKKLNNNQQGVATPVIVALVLVLVAVGGGAYFAISSRQDNKTENNSVSVDNTEDKCKQAGGDNDFCQFTKASTNLKTEPYVLQFSTTQEGKQIQIKLSTDGKGNTIFEGDEFKAITLNGQYYIQNNGTWLKYSSPSGQESPLGGMQDVSAAIDDLNLEDTNALGERVTKVGEEKCGELTCLKYEVKSKIGEQEEKVLIWFDNKDHKLRKIEMTDENGNPATMQISYEDVVVSEPSPVQELSPGPLTLPN